MMTMSNPRWKIAAAVAAVMALSAPAAVGVYRALEPTRGPVAAGLAALGFELAYLTVSLLTLHPTLRTHARFVALGAVFTSVALNVLADYAARVPGGLASWPQAVARFDPLALGLAVAESAPLAVLAFALASLLHRLAEVPESEPAAAPSAAAPLYAGPVAVYPDATWPRVEVVPPFVDPRYPAPERVDGPRIDPTHQDAAAIDTTPGQPRANTERIRTPPANTPTYSCRYCGAKGLTKAEQLEHGRRHARERKAAQA